MSTPQLKERILERLEDVRRSLRDLKRNVERGSARSRGEAIRVVTEAAELAAEVRLWQHEEIDQEKVPR